MGTCWNSLAIISPKSATDAIFTGIIFNYFQTHKPQKSKKIPGGQTGMRKIPKIFPAGRRVLVLRIARIQRIPRVSLLSLNPLKLKSFLGKLIHPPPPPPPPGPTPALPPPEAPLPPPSHHTGPDKGELVPIVLLMVINGIGTDCCSFLLCFILFISTTGPNT